VCHVEVNGFASRPIRFSPGSQVTGTYCVGGRAWRL